MLNTAKSLLNISNKIKLVKCQNVLSLTNLSEILKNNLYVLVAKMLRTNNFFFKKLSNIYIKSTFIFNCYINFNENCDKQKLKIIQLSLINDLSLFYSK